MEIKEMQVEELEARQVELAEMGTDEVSTEEIESRAAELEAIKAELETRLRRAVSASVKEAMTPAFMAELIRAMAADFAKDPEAQITVLASARDAEALAAAVKDTLGASFKAVPQVLADNSVKSGLQVSFGGNEVFFDFSEEAITGLVGAYAGEKLARILENR